MHRKLSIDLDSSVLIENLENPRSSSTAIFVCTLAAFAGLMFGLDIGVISGAIPFIQREFHINDRVIEWIVSSMMLGAALGAVVAGRLSSLLGRKRLLLISGLSFVAGSLLCSIATNASTLIVARFVLGLAIGIASFTAPLYLAEVAPEKYRGAMISLYGFMLTVGVLAAFISDTLFSAHGQWRWMLGVIAIPGALFLLGILSLPDSPSWLVMKDRADEAHTVLRKLWGSDVAALREIRAIRTQLLVSQEGWSLFRVNANFRRSVGLGVLLQVLQQLTGINVILYYAPRLFEGMGFAAQAPMLFTTAIGLTNVVFSAFAILLVRLFPNKRILWAGFLTMAVSLIAIGGMLARTPLGHNERYITVAMLLLFIAAFASSAAPIVWTVCSEVQPLKGRGFGVSCSTFTNWSTNWLVGFTFLSLLDHIGSSYTFWLFASFNLLGVALTLWLVPETRGLRLEMIERNLMAGKKLRAIGL